MSDVNAELLAALKELYLTAPIGLECKDFHHSHGERHRHDEPCKPAAAYLAAISRAANAIQQAEAK